LVNAEIALARRRRADGVSFVGQPNVQRFAVCVAKHRDRLDAEFAARAENAHGNLAAIGDQDFLEHRNVERERSLAWRGRPLGSLASSLRSSYLRSFWRSLHLMSTMWFSSSAFLNSAPVTTS